MRFPGGDFWSNLGVEDSLQRVISAFGDEEPSKKAIHRCHIENSHVSNNVENYIRNDVGKSVINVVRSHVGNNVISYLVSYVFLSYFPMSFPKSYFWNL